MLHEMHGNGWVIIWIAVLIILFVAVWMVARYTGLSSFERNSAPLEILKRRYARGEIDKAEYEERKQNLMEK